MDTKKHTKINQLITQWPDGLPYTMKYLNELGYSRDLVHQYIRSNWLLPVGRGIYAKNNDSVSWKGILASLQYQLSYPIHTAGKTALELQGISHYMRTGQSQIWLYSEKSQLPKWFQLETDEYKVQYVRTNFLSAYPSDSILELDQGGFKLKVSSKERAILETLYLVPDRQGFDEAFKLLEMLPALRPDLLNQLLQKCSSIKTKRLFLFMANRLSYPWYGMLERNSINLGSGKRQIVRDGVLDKEYLITIPRDYTS